MQEKRQDGANECLWLDLHNWFSHKNNQDTGLEYFAKLKNYFSRSESNDFTLKMPLRLGKKLTYRNAGTTHSNRLSNSDLANKFFFTFCGQAKTAMFVPLKITLKWQEAKSVSKFSID